MYIYPPGRKPPPHASDVDDASRSRSFFRVPTLIPISLKSSASRICAVSNCATSLFLLNNHKEGKSLLRKSIPVARRIHGESDTITLTLQMNYARALYDDPSATLGDLRESVETLEKTARIARRVFGSAHPEVVRVEKDLHSARVVLAARERQSPYAAGRG